MVSVVTSLVAQTVKRLPTMWETQVKFLDWEDPLEKEMDTHSIFWHGEFHGLYSQTAILLDALSVNGHL